MLNIRPIVVNKDMIILGGIIRYKAQRNWTKRNSSNYCRPNRRPTTGVLIKDNTSGGEWDWEVLANEWNNEELEAWGWI